MSSGKSHRILNVDHISQKSDFWLTPAGSGCFYQRIGALSITPYAIQHPPETSVASIAFNGSAISLVGYVQNGNDILPELFVSIDNGSESSQGKLRTGYFMWYQSPILTDGLHAVQFRVTFPNASLSTVVFDHAILDITESDALPASERVTTILDDAHPSIIYSSDWASGNNTGVYRYENTTRVTSTLDTTLSFPFNGVGIMAVASVGENQRGNYSVEYYIDDSAVHVVDISWPAADSQVTGLSDTAGGILTLFTDATLPGDHVLHMRLANLSGSLPLTLDYVVATEALSSDESWYHPDRSSLIFVPLVWLAVNIASLVYFRRRIIKSVRDWKFRRHPTTQTPTMTPSLSRSNSVRDPESANLDPSENGIIQLTPLNSALPNTGQHESDPLVEKLPSGLTDAYYDKGKLEALYTPYALWFSLAFGVALVFAGIAVRIISSRGIVGGATDILKLANRPPFDEARRHGWAATDMTSIQRTVLSICITGVLTVVDGLVSTPRGTSLKWALAREGRLQYNSNSHFFTASGDTFSSTGTVGTVLYVLSTILMFASAGFMTIPFTLRDGIGGSPNRHLLFSNRYYVIFHYLPIILTGLSVSLQALLSLLSYRAISVPTWSAHPFDVAGAAYSLGIVHRTPGRCLADLDPDVHASAPAPKKPTRKHPLLHDVRPAFTLLPPLGFFLGTTIFALTFSPTLDPNHTFLGPTDLNTASMSFLHGPLATPGRLALCGLILAAFQAPLSVFFHALDVGERVLADEAAWRRTVYGGGRRSGLLPEGRILLLFGAKVGIQWLYSNGIAFVTGAFPLRGPLSSNGLMLVGEFDTVWHIGAAVSFVGFYLYMSGACLTITAILYRVFGELSPGTFQPSTYGHIQTLVNAIDDWSPVMYWGHKTGGEVCHAGTSPHPLGPLRPDAVYE